MPLYTRDTIDTLQPTTDRSLCYWRAQARAIFATHPQVMRVECVRSGRKRDSRFLAHGAQTPSAPDVYVIVASTAGGRGRARQEFPPRKATRC
jgi:hypothetical protein